MEEWIEDVWSGGWRANLLLLVQICHILSNVELRHRRLVDLLLQSLRTIFFFKLCNSLFLFNNNKVLKVCGKCKDAEFLFWQRPVLSFVAGCQPSLEPPTWTFWQKTATEWDRKENRFSKSSNSASLF